ncbi:hypothetical protein PLESTB_001617300 [Pleodorina starrii]|uniref:TLC domain-containing protein n=1 Tax=Pleodorina starrii TaxID=330485 RepID=A0A9W6BYA3_9CHLO|nr:hypothetical protein PLESTM_001893700 [Pleodorina starrii]GLC60473.1 hypothetical protein PLESTB_001617300 [Pleodorina starrii]GLC77245.1 hypothetical protein PLESTF_001903500 [Pleodorina starrii]
MAHPIYLPDGALERLGELIVMERTLVTSDGKLTPLGVCAYWALASTLVFTLVYKLSRYYTPLYFKGYKQLTNHEQRDWDTRLGNIIYSAYIVYWAARTLALEDTFWAPGPQPMVRRTTPDTFAVLGVSTGFFVHELFITIKYWMGGSAMLLHHVGSLASVLSAIWWAEAHWMTMWMLSTEFTTPFIAFRYMLEKAGFKSHPLYLINGIAILASWTVARLATFPPFFWMVWQHRQEIPLMQPLTQTLLLVFPAVLALLNVFWYTKILRGAIKLLGPKRKAKAE